MNMLYAKDPRPEIDTCFDRVVMRSMCFLNGFDFLEIQCFRVLSMVSWEKMQSKSSVEHPDLSRKRFKKAVFFNFPSPTSREQYSVIQAHLHQEQCQPTAIFMHLFQNIPQKEQQANLLSEGYLQ